MYVFRNMLPPFLKNSNGGQNTQRPREQTLHPGRASPTTLHRKSRALEASLESAESHLSTLRAKVHATISAYEQHYRFLRHVAYSAANASTPLINNEKVLKKREEELVDAFENVELAIQVARLKARAQKQETESLIKEMDRGGERQDKTKIHDEAASRARALER